MRVVVSSRQRNVSLRCVQVLGPTNSWRTKAVTSSAPTPAKRSALWAAPGHSG